MENEELLQEEESSTLTLTDENGVDTEFEYMDCIEYEGKEYLCLLPADEESAEIVILEVEPVDEENENYLTVDDDATLDAVYSIFKEHFKDMVFDTIIQRNIRLSEAPSHGKPIILYDVICNGTTNYLNLAKEVLEKNAR